MTGSSGFTEDQVLRYSRHIILPKIGAESGATVANLPQVAHFSGYSPRLVHEGSFMSKVKVAILGCGGMAGAHARRRHF